MKIGIDSLYLQFADYQAGLYQYVYHLISGLQEIDSENEYILYFFYKWHIKEDQLINSYELNPNFKKRICRVPYRVLSSFSKLVPVSPILGKVDVLHGPVFRLLPKGCYKKSVVTIHDLKFLKPPGMISNQNDITFFKGPTIDAIRRADCIIAVSEFVRNDLIENFRISTGRIKVIHSGIGKEFNPIQDPIRLKAVQSKFTIKNKYLLFVGFIETKKNLPRLIEAYSRIRNTLPEPYQLVIAGPHGPATQEVIQKIKELSLERDVILTGQVSREDLPLLYTGASLFVFPSLYEGFGFPPLEAMASGTPVIASNTGSIPEVIGENGFLIDPYNLDKMAEAIYMALTDDNLRESLRRKGLSHCKKFTWEQAASQVLQIYREL